MANGDLKMANDGFKVANGTVVESSWLATLHIPIGGTPYGYRLRVYVVDTGAEPDAQVPLLLSNPTLGEWDALMDSRTGVYQLHSVNRYGVRCARSRAGHHLFPIVAMATDLQQHTWSVNDRTDWSRHPRARASTPEPSDDAMATTELSG